MGNFKIIHAVMAILVLCEHFSGKLCSNFLTLILNTSPILFAHFQLCVLKTSGIFQSLGTICSFLLKGKVKRGGMAQCSP